MPFLKFHNIDHHVDEQRRFSAFFFPVCVSSMSIQMVKHVIKLDKKPFNFLPVSVHSQSIHMMTHVIKQDEWLQSFLPVFVIPVYPHDNSRDQA